MAETEKTEKATPKRRRDERKKGNVFTSKDVVTVARIFIGFYAIWLYFPFIVTRVRNAFFKITSLPVTLTELTPRMVQEIYFDVALVFAITALPLLLISAFTAVIATGVQTKWLFAWEKLKFKFSKLNPITGMKKFFQLKQLVELFKSILKITIIVLVLYNVNRKRMMEYPALMDFTPAQAGEYIWRVVIGMVNTVGIALIAIAAFDYFYSRWEFEKNIKMTKQEVKEEFKQLEGDPKIKGKIRQKQQQIAMSRMMQKVPEADVVIRNPSHFAVALKYDITHDAAPTVVAKGQDEIALKIIKIAQENGVDIVENVPLARGLYGAVEIGRMIPAEFFAAVAEVLAIIFSKQRKEGVYAKNLK